MTWMTETLHTHTHSSGCLQRMFSLDLSESHSKTLCLHIWFCVMNSSCTTQWTCEIDEYTHALSLLHYLGVWMLPLKTNDSQHESPFDMYNICGIDGQCRWSEQGLQAKMELVPYFTSRWRTQWPNLKEDRLLLHMGRVIKSYDHTL